MNLPIIIPAVLIAVAAIAGMLILAREYATLFQGFCHLSGEAAVLRESAHWNQLKVKCAESELALAKLAAPRRDPKTGRYVKVAHD